MSNEKLPVVMLTIRRARPPVNCYHTYRIALPAGPAHSVFSILESAMGEMSIAELEVGIDDYGQRSVQRIDDLEASKKFAWTPFLNSKPLEDSERRLSPGDAVLWDFTKVPGS